MLLTHDENLSCDVLVIGGGGAGLRSAIAARLHRADVLLASKTSIGAASNTCLSKAVIAATGWGAPEDGAQAHIEDTLAGGRFLNDPEMVTRMAERAHAEIAFLSGCGVAFDTDGGRYRLTQVAGHRHQRHVYGENWRGSDLLIPLRRRAEEIGVRFGEKVFITRLTAAGNRICGAAGIRADGRFLAIHAKAVILATGGYAQVYLNTNNAPGITGDGHALAYELGIPLKDMEFVQFYPIAAGRHANRLILYEKVLSQPGVVVCNEQGEDIFQAHGIDDPAAVTRDRLAQVIFHETRQGVFLNMEGLPEDAARALFSILPSAWRRGRKVFKIAPTAHYCMGGIATDPDGETPLKGLFAAGEAAGGMHGANRLGGNALAEIFTMGSWVGRKAAERAADIGAATAPGHGFAEERFRLEGSYSRQGQNVRELITEVKHLMWEDVGVVRHKTGLAAALRRLQEPLPRVAVSSPADLIRLLEYRNMRCVAEMVCRAALERTESRGSHFRRDYPEEDDRRWLRNIVLRKSGSGMQVETMPVKLDAADSEVR